MLRKRFWPALVLIMPLALAMGACGDDDDNGNGNGDQDAGEMDAGDQDAGDEDAGNGCEPGDITISGTAALHPAAATSTATLDGAELALETAGGRLSGNPQVLTAGEDCSDAVTTLDETGAFTFEMVDASAVALGLIAVVEGTDFVTSIIGLAQPPIEDITDASVFAVPTDLEAALSTLAGEQLADGGFIIGMFMDETGAPVDGVTVVDQQGNAIESAIYPNATLDAEDGDGNTSALGLFLIPTATSLGTYCGSSDGTAVDFSCQPAATQAGTAFQMFLGPDTGA